MRNLKRALSLTLASVMLLGMMVVGSSAAGFPDVDEKDNVEAIEVLQAVAVMVGDKDTGNFRPDAPVSRAEMAVIMSNLLGLTTSYYVSTCPFEDVSGSYSWARGPVGAAYASKVLSGRTATTFDPAATVTAVEAASMIMRGLGYFQHTGDFADGFNVATVRQANLIGLFSGIKGDATTPLTRNQVAQMALNALQANIVDFTGTPGIKFDGVEVGYKAEYTPRTSPDEIYSAIGNLSTNINGQDQYYVQLGEELYDGDLELRDNDSDDFERPARTWLYNGKEIGSYAKEELVKQTYTSGVSCKTLYDLLTRANLLEYDFEYYVDGKLSAADEDDILTRSTNDFGATGNGVLTEVYVDTTAKEITIVSVNTWLAQATADYNKTRETISLKVYSTTTGTTKTVDVDDVPGIENLKKDEWVLVNMSEKERDKLEVVAVDDVEIMSDVAITKFSKGSDIEVNSDTVTGFFKNLTTGGQNYDSSAKARYSDEALDLYSNNLLTNKTYNVYLDNYGYAIGVELFSGEDNYVFITGFDGNGSNIANGTAKANAIFTDGTTKAINVNVKDTNKNIDAMVTAATSASKDYYEEWVDPATTGKAFSHNRWYTYTEDKNGEYTLNPVERMFTTEVAKGATTPALAALTIKCNNVRLTEDPSQGTEQGPVPNTGAAGWTARRAYGNDDSIYIIAEMDETSKAAADQDLTGKVITDVDAIYTGVQNVEIDVFAASAADAQVTNNKDGNDAGAGNEEYAIYDSVYTLYDKNNYIIASVIVGDAKGGDATLAYIKTAAKSERIDGDTYYWEFDAILDGTIQTLTIKSKFANTNKLLQVGEVMELRFDGEYVNSVKALATADLYTENQYDQQTIDDEKVYDVNHLSVAGTPTPATDKADNLNWQGNTLYLTDDHSDYGLTVLKDAKAVVCQPENGSTKWREYDSVNDAVDSLGDADGNDTNNQLGYNGRIVAVLDGRGVAKWVLFLSNTDVKTGTIKPSGGKSSATELSVGASPTGAGIAAILKGEEPGGVYTIKESFATDATIVFGAKVKSEDLMFFPFIAAGTSDSFSFTIRKGSEIWYNETGTATGAGAHILYLAAFDTDGDGSAYAAGTTGKLVTAGKFDKGEYTYTLNCGTNSYKGTFTIG